MQMHPDKNLPSSANLQSSGANKALIVAGKIWVNGHPDIYTYPWLNQSLQLLSYWGMCHGQPLPCRKLHEPVGARIHSNRSLRLEQKCACETAGLSSTAIPRACATNSMAPCVQIGG